MKIKVSQCPIRGAGYAVSFVRGLAMITWTTRQKSLMALCAWTVFISPLLLAQTFNGAISGAVVDSSNSFQSARRYVLWGGREELALTYD